MARSNTLSHAFRLATMKGLALICGVLFLKAAKASAGQVMPVPESDISWGSAFVGTLFMIICSELGDKTFLITAVLSMRCTKVDSSKKLRPNEKRPGSRWHVFAGGFLALVVMTLMAAAGGQVLPLLLKQELRTIFMVCLLVIFGAKMLHEAAVYEENSDEPEELKDLAQSEESMSQSRLFVLARSFFSPVFIQAASLTLMAEWGDRSQLATFALAADRSASAVCLGAILGHGLCTALAVVGGNVLAKRISERVVLVLGGICFLSFAAFTAVGELYFHGGAASS
ncbi:transmembrane protein, putative [Eimeria necatrix]|uniref:GDT1 family protein n=1 Tax=Eimeria necatrix TaxID=51315 RepID=U6MTI8_9EIME|nr:transmembrane protein, putative [Eimeria necatrix]CDJ67331.1 transmembrane protein, putative [Eimeria necatrix]